MIFFSTINSPLQPMQSTVPLNVVLLIVAMLCLALYAGMRGGKIMWPIVFAVGAIVLIICHPGALSTPIGVFEDIGVSPNAQVASLLSTSFLLTYIFACALGLKDKKKGYLFNKSMWLGGLVAWVLICNTAAIATLLSAN